MTTYYQGMLNSQKMREHQRENEAREATSIHTVQSTGVGAQMDGAPFKFANPFVLKPTVSYGSEMTLIPDQAVWGLPRCSGSVVRWQMNGRGFYIGAFLLIATDLEPLTGASPVAQPNIRILHHFQFRGLAYKALGDEVMTQVQETTIEPLSVDL